MVLTEFDFAMSTHRGVLRAGNEDFCAASREDGVFVVCDGMGGAVAGEVASRLAVDTFMEMVGSGENSAGGTVQLLRNAIRLANQAVYRRSRQTPDLAGMGTTLVAAILEALPPARGQNMSPVGRLWIGHVGDSRCYLLRDGALRQLTTDHSFVEEQVKTGFLTYEQAELSPMRHVITRAIGTDVRVEPDIQALATFPGDVLLLASDGLSGELTDAAIQAVLQRIGPEPEAGALERACGELIAAANAHGGHDNVTALLLYVR